jgi:hypothetical protein
MAARLTLADLDPDTRDALNRGIREFNEWRFYDCHETLEDVWREVGSKGDETTLANFYQGIIKVAAGFHHILRDNHKGAVNLLTDAFRLLERFRPVTLGVDVDALLAEVRPCLDRMIELGPARLREFDRKMIPRIRVVEEGSSAAEGATS